MWAGKPAAAEAVVGGGRGAPRQAVGVVLEAERGVVGGGQRQLRPVGAPALACRRQAVAGRRV